MEDPAIVCIGVSWIGPAYTCIIGAAFWNFVGAGVFGGGTLNAPLVNYHEHGTFLTLNHAHRAVCRVRAPRHRADLFLPALCRVRHELQPLLPHFVVRLVPGLRTVPRAADAD